MIHATAIGNERRDVLPAPESLSGETVDEAAAIIGLTRRFSFETTRPTTAELMALHGIVPPETPMYFSAVPGRAHDELAEAAVAASKAGFEAVPHIAARSFPSREALDNLLARLATEAGVRRVLVIGGDYDRPRGPYSAAIDVIESGILTQHGIVEIGVAGYPDGHPRVSDYELTRALGAKMEAAESIGLRVSIVTQFGFDAAPIINWLERLRNDGFDQPVLVGMAGPTSPSALLRYARRCGVRASSQGLARHAGLAKHLFGGVAPDAIVRPLAVANAAGSLGRIVPHLYSFGGLAASARWTAAVAAGRIELDRTDGFRVKQ